jgi:hypothetical protein
VRRLDVFPGRAIMRGQEFFSLGGLLSRWWQPTYILLPWAFTSAMLTVAAMWDFWSRGGAIDYTILGLAAYELMLGLLEEQRETEPHANRGDLQPVESRD